MLSNKSGRVMVALLVLVLIAVAAVVMTRPNAVMAQQGPPQGGGGMGGGMMGGGMMRMPMSCVAASGDFVFVTQGNMLYKFDAKTLTLAGKTELPKPPMPAPPAGPPPPGQ